MNMNFKSRIKVMEKILYHNNKGFEFINLLDTDYVYKGKPFNSFDEMTERMNLVELPTYLTDNYTITLLDKGLLSHNSKEAEDLRHRALKEMQDNM